MNDDELIAFYRARLDEDEYAAKAAELRFPGPWEQGDDPGSSLPSAVTMFDSRDESIGVIRGGYVAGHIARHDPARVLRDIEADRKLLAACEAAFKRMPSHSVGGYQDAFEEAIRIRATRFIGHPDYQEQWALWL